MSRWIVLISLLIISIACRAQSDDEGFANKMIDLVVSPKITTDTDYVVRPSTKFMAKVGYNAFGSVLDVSSDDVTASLAANTNNSIGFNFSWKGLGLGYSFLPGFMAKSKINKEWDFDYYSQKFGFHFVYQKVSDFDGELRRDDEKPVQLDIRNVFMKNLIVDFFWVFKNKKFSMPAVFDHSMIQKRSAGSWMVSSIFSTRVFESDISFDSEDFKTFKDFRNMFVALGGGYGYNFVSKNKRWLLHGSIIPHLSIWKDVDYSGSNQSQSSTVTSSSANSSTTITNSTTSTSESENNGFGLDPQFFSHIKLGLTYSFRRSYWGFSGYIQNDVMNQQKLEISYLKIQVNLFYGIRFGKM